MYMSINNSSAESKEIVMKEMNTRKSSSSSSNNIEDQGTAISLDDAIKKAPEDEK